MSELKKLFIMTHNMAGGGCEHVIQQLANRLSRAGVSCTVLTEYRAESFYPLEKSVSLVPLTDGDSLPSERIPAAYLRLRRLVKKERPDAVLAMPEKVNVWTVMALVGTGVPVVVSERNDPRRHPENRFKRLLRRIVYPLAAGYVFQTAQQAAYFSERIRKRGTVLDNPLETELLPEPYMGAREKTVVTAARLDPQKNLPLLIAAFSAFYRTHPDWRLVVYGEGKERERLERLAAALPAGTAVLPGAVNDLPEKLLRAGMFVLSSNFEGMPNALIEAMALGLPCVSTDCPAGGPASLIVSGQNGLLVPAADENALAAAMARFADDTAFSRACGAAAVGVRTRLDAGTVVKKWRDYLEQV